MNFYNAYLNMCNKKGESPSRVALNCGISKASVNRWKHGYQPTDANLQKLADYFGVTVDYLLGKEEKEKPGAVKATEPMIELWEKYIKLSASDKKTIDDMFDFLLSKPEYEKKDNVG